MIYSQVIRRVLLGGVEHVNVDAVAGMLSPSCYDVVYGVNVAADKGCGFLPSERQEQWQFAWVGVGIKEIGTHKKSNPFL